MTPHGLSQKRAGAGFGRAAAPGSTRLSWKKRGITGGHGRCGLGGGSFTTDGGAVDGFLQAGL